MFMNTSSVPFNKMPVKHQTTLLLALNDALDVLGSQWRSLVLTHLEKHFGDNLYEDSVSIDELESALVGTFGNGALILIDRLRVNLEQRQGTIEFY